MTDHAIFEVIELLRTARKAEAECILALADQRAHVERMKSIAIAEAYQSGLVDGKNAETRKVQEIKFLSDLPALREAELLERQIESKHVAARIEREYQDDRYRALLALVRVEQVAE